MLTQHKEAFSDLVVSVDLQQMWQNSLQIIFYEFFCFDVHGVEQNWPEATASCN